MEARNAPAEDFFTAMEYHAAKNKGMEDRAKNNAK
jgi:hypothetical protein